MKRSFFHLPVMAILAFHLAPLSPIHPPSQFQTPIHRPAVAPVPGPAKAVDTSVTAERVEPTPTPTPATVVTARPISGSQTDWMAAAGIAESDWAYVEFIVSHESGWRVNAVNSSSGATGLCQSLPASKMASAGADYLTNPVTQLRWCHAYAQSRYKGWYNAYLYWQTHRYW